MPAYKTKTMANGSVNSITRIGREKQNKNGSAVFGRKETLCNSNANFFAAGIPGRI